MSFDRDRDTRCNFYSVSTDDDRTERDTTETSNIQQGNNSHLPGAMSELPLSERTFRPHVLDQLQGSAALGKIDP